MVCPQCGAQIPDGSVFCPSCGASVSVGQQQADPFADNQQPGFNSQPNYGQSPAPYGAAPQTPIKTDRSIAAYILLSIVTCGIYGLWFFYRLAKDVNTMCTGDGESTPGLAAFILLSILTCNFYAFYWYYKVGNRLAANAPRYGLSFQENGTSILLWSLVGYITCGIGGLVAMYLIIKNTNALATAYNSRLYAR